MCSDFKNATPEQVCIQLKRHLYKSMVVFEKDDPEPELKRMEITSFNIIVVSEFYMWQINYYNWYLSSPTSQQPFAAFHKPKCIIDEAISRISKKDKSWKHNLIFFCCVSILFLTHNRRYWNAMSVVCSE